MTEPAKMDVWASVEVEVEAFPRNPFTEEDFDRFAVALYTKYEGEDTPGFGSSNGVWHVTFIPTPNPSERAHEVALLLSEVGLEGDVTARLVWTVMKHPDTQES